MKNVEITPRLFLFKGINKIYLPLLPETITYDIQQNPNKLYELSFVRSPQIYLLENSIVDIIYQKFTNPNVYFDFNKEGWIKRFQFDKLPHFGINAFSSEIEYNSYDTISIYGKLIYSCEIYVME